MLSPDGIETEGITINGQFPGPPIEAAMGDRIQVQVVNQLSKDFSIHWHGMRQFGTLRSDGVPGVTQEPIPPGGSYFYDFEVGDQMGTWWYHAHTGLDLIQAFGSFVVFESEDVKSDLILFDDRFEYDFEMVVMLSEWWHQSPSELESHLVTTPFIFPPPPNSILINGQTSPVFTVERGKRYRLRLIAASGGENFSLHIPFHDLLLIEADGTVLEPLSVQRIVIGPGQRYSAILTADQLMGSFAVSVRTNHSATTASLLYSDAPSDLSPQLNVPHSTQIWQDSALHTSNWYHRNFISHHIPPPIEVDREIILNIKDTQENGLFKFTINGVTHPPHPSLRTTYPIQVGESIQVIFQHFPSNSTECAPHPWHLHGHAFYTVAYGPGLYNPHIHNADIQAKLQLSPKLPLLRDTLITYPQLTKPTTTSCGWYAIRFIADNPGDWFFHCHITPHLIMGKYIVIHEE
ncbi:hypothetical protein DSO57_1013019 [Entomophthora muscae]|uniref:Uncharacterized protein n=1 Tax=Entomophthora muscae TaxID=34485 RepID=A0ACC2RKM1_9FUNG|nr:hypothetical protein DSO57_1013019 [Entomophthora muscae]